MSALAGQCFGCDRWTTRQETHDTVTVWVCDGCRTVQEVRP